MTSPPKESAQLESDEQKVLQDMKLVVGDEPVSTFQLQLASQWILDKSIAMEKKNYDGAYEEVDTWRLPSNANIISSH